MCLSRDGVWYSGYRRSVELFEAELFDQTGRGCAIPTPAQLLGSQHAALVFTWPGVM